MSMKSGALGLLLSAITAAAVLGGCVNVNFGVDGPTGSVRGTGELTQAEFPVGAFRKVELGGNMEVVYKNAPECAVTVSIQENLKEYLVVEVEGDTLHVSSTKSFSTTYDKTPVLTIAAPTLEAVVVRGSADMKDSDPIEGESFLLKITGAGTVELVLNVTTLELEQSGVGDVRLSGAAQNADVRITGAGELGGLGLQTENAKISISGIGDAGISCSDNLEINISGTGSLEYRGSPNVSKSITGIGDVQQVS